MSGTDDAKKKIREAHMDIFNDSVERLRELYDDSGPVGQQAIITGMENLAGNAGSLSEFWNRINSENGSVFVGELAKKARIDAGYMKLKDLAVKIANETGVEVNEFEKAKENIYRQILDYEKGGRIPRNPPSSDRVFTYLTILKKEGDYNPYGL